MKNLFVAAPLVFGKRLDDGNSFLRTAIAVLLFCALSGAVYLMNDVADIEKDRAHPKKRFRPIASGKISPRFALWLAAVLATVAISAGLVLDLRYGAVAGGYLALNLAYSFSLKHIAYVDVVSIALGFFLRVLAGGYAIGVPVSEWLLAVTALLAAFLAFGKRMHELSTALASGNAEKQRAVLSRYRPMQLRVSLYLFGALTCGAYVMYTLSDHTALFFRTQWMVLSAPFCLIGIMRFVWLVGASPRAESPTDAMLRDSVFVANLVLWCISIVSLIYVG